MKLAIFRGAEPELWHEVHSLREQLGRRQQDLQLSFECLALEQSACKAAEGEVARIRRELSLERADKLKARAWMAHAEERLQCERRYHSRRERAFREALRAELRDQGRLAASLKAAQDRIRELEALLVPRSGLQVAQVRRRTDHGHRVWVDRWAACFSQC